MELIDNGDGSYSFKSPGGKLKIEVTFRKMSAAADCPRDESCPLSGFSDLDADAWYHDGIHYCLDEGLMAGTGSVIFAPDAATSRAMIVTILWRLQGCPEAAGAAAFTDVAPGAWYAGAVAWAVSEGIAEGYDDGSFRPDDAITREQLAAMLWRYAAKPAAEDTLSAFSDGAETGSWARQAMNWAVGSGLITGVSSSVLDPGGQAVRAQAAVILMRFTQAV